jgi:hypothetical protein
MSLARCSIACGHTSRQVFLHRLGRYSFPNWAATPSPARLCSRCRDAPRQALCFWERCWQGGRRGSRGSRADEMWPRPWPRLHRHRLAGGGGGGGEGGGKGGGGGGGCEHTGGGDLSIASGPAAWAQPGWVAGARPLRGGAPSSRRASAGAAGLGGSPRSSGRTGPGAWASRRPSQRSAAARTSGRSGRPSRRPWTQRAAAGRRRGRRRSRSRLAWWSWSGRQCQPAAGQ